MHLVVKEIPEILTFVKGGLVTYSLFITISSDAVMTPLVRLHCMHRYILVELLSCKSKVINIICGV
jgi:hypothetical protein